MNRSIPALALANGDLPEQAVEPLFRSLGFQDWKNANTLVQKLGKNSHHGGQFLQVLPILLGSMPACPDPDLALVNFERLISNADPAGLLAEMVANPRVVEILLTIFSGSQYLTEILLKEPENLTILLHPEKLAITKSYEQVLQVLRQATNGMSISEFADKARVVQKRELLRIGAADLLAVLDLPTVTQQLSILADACVQACLERAATHTHCSPNAMVVLGMGKLGGLELNYSSDIDLLFIQQDDNTDLTRTAQTLIDLLTRVTSEGFLYRVDMRLRPWGRDGALVPSVGSYAKYARQSAKLWEKQALIKARPIAGNLELGDLFLTQVEPLIYNEDPQTIRANVLGMKSRTEEILRERGKEWGQVKLGAGSIRDVEFVIQYLQLLHGRDNPKLRKRSSLQALRRLHRFHLLSTEETRILTDGYIFLRTIEHFLQSMHYRQTYALPTDPHSIFLLSRRLGFQNSESFLERYEQHCQAIRAVYARHLMPESEARPGQGGNLNTEDPVVLEHVSRMDAEYALAFSPPEILNHATRADKLSAEMLCSVQVKPLEHNHFEVTIIAFDYLGELSLICGLFFLHGLNIHSGDIFTYSSPNSKKTEKAGSRWSRSARHEKIVDVFLVQAREGQPDWEAYTKDLQDLLALLHAGNLREARSQLALKIGKFFEAIGPREYPLLPIEMTFDNDQNPLYTVIKIRTADTIGFLYEFTNALSLSHIYINRMIISTDAANINDMLFVNDERGNKILDAEKLQELRTAAVLIKHFTHLLPRSPNPAQALLHFREFLAKLFSQPNWSAELNALENPQVIDNLARLLGVSDFLWDDFIRMQYSNLFPIIKETDTLSISKTRQGYEQELSEILQKTHAGPQLPDDNAAWKKALNEFKDREMFRIDMRHILGLTAEFWDFSEELTNLTDVVVNTILHLVAEDLRVQHGSPRLPNGDLAPLAVMALGKCGGRELGFASDIELMFIFGAEGLTDGPEPILASLYYEKVVSAFLGAIRAKQEGIFQVDLRLRPYGNAGSLAVSLAAFRNYYCPTGPAWPYERQALVKMRPVAGDAQLGEQVCALRDEYVYNGTPFDVIAMRAMREKQVRHLVKAGKFNAKFSPGGLVDIEYLVQGMQINFGSKDHALRLTNIRAEMVALHQAGLLADADYTKLHKAHTFLRWLIDSMRVVRGNSKDVTVPAPESEEFLFLARRLKFGNDVEKLSQTISQVQADVVEMNRRLLQ